MVTTNPSSATVTSGETATFTAAAAGSRPRPCSGSSRATAAPLSAVSERPRPLLVHRHRETSGDEYEAVFTNSAGSATTAAAALTVTSTPVLGASSNWSGYADTGSVFDAVTGSWTVPTVTCSGTKSAYSAVLDRHRRRHELDSRAGRDRGGLPLRHGKL